MIFCFQKRKKRKRAQPRGATVAQIASDMKALERKKDVEENVKEHVEEQEEMEGVNAVAEDVVAAADVNGDFTEFPRFEMRRTEVTQQFESILFQILSSPPP